MMHCTPLSLLLAVLLLLFVAKEVSSKFEFVEPSLNWEVLKSSNGIKFTSRNCHATTMYKGRIYVTGGKTDLYKLWNTLYSFKAGDVWWSLDGQDWVQESELRGDYFVQNADALQPSAVAPWFERYGHTLDAVDIDRDGTDDFMIQLGGFSPDPSNDIWITYDGITWSYSGEAPWEPRGWHTTVTFNQVCIFRSSDVSLCCTCVC